MQKVSFTSPHVPNIKPTKEPFDYRSYAAWFSKEALRKEIGSLKTANVAMAAELEVLRAELARMKADASPSPNGALAPPSPDRTNPAPHSPEPAKSHHVQPTHEDADGASSNQSSTHSANTTTTSATNHVPPTDEPPTPNNQYGNQSAEATESSESKDPNSDQRVDSNIADDTDLRIT